jgi:hypothetical protein
MIKKLMALCLLLFSAFKPFCQDIEDQLQDLLDTALRIKITARIIQEQNIQSFFMKNEYKTIPGRSIALKFQGKNIRIDVVLTPYQSDAKNKKYLLLAQGQVWITRTADNKLSYSNSVKSIPVSMGEKIHFYPLGIAEETIEKKGFNIELEIQLLPYRDNSTEEE